MKPKRHLSVFFLAMMNVAIILSLRGLPLMAKEGLSLIFYLLFSLIIFLIPTALVSAELATGWPEHGGIFRWVSEAFGQRMGFTTKARKPIGFSRGMRASISLSCSCMFVSTILSARCSAFL